MQACAHRSAFGLCPLQDKPQDALVFRGQDQWLWPVVSLLSVLVALITLADDVLSHLTP
ncbi:hypothetical protein [Gluconacetobacter tumulisoli]|uniref:Uncharacterized protein n=1 Tax=Gluconacetobacter tumulisoli TaxID=1286189 RepID=A0A7W4K4Z2_9PROT|nr:hypothetical protein [Gluconacetobacter tumulisoli]MBB2200472.1 hypothetical protein [Gluconacetobacter tumulisoli]